MKMKKIKKLLKLSKKLDKTLDEFSFNLRTHLKETYSEEIAKNVFDVARDKVLDLLNVKQDVMTFLRSSEKSDYDKLVENGVAQ